MHVLPHQPHGIRLFYTGIGRAATITLDLKQASFRLTEADQQTLAKLPNLRWHRSCISNEKVVIRALRKNLRVALDAVLKILNYHTGENFQADNFTVV